MATDWGDLFKLKQQLGFYEAGGGQRPEATQIGEALGSVGKGVSSGVEDYNSILRSFFQNKKAQLDNQMLQQELTQNQRLAQPVKLLFGTANTPGMTAGTDAPSQTAGVEGQTITSAPQTSAVPESLKPYQDFNVGEISKLAGVQGILGTAGLKNTQNQLGQQKLSEEKDRVYYDPKNPATQSDAPVEGYLYGKRADANALAGKMGIQQAKAKTSGFSDDDIKNTLEAVRNGKQALSQLPGGMSPMSLKGRVITMGNTLYPGMDWIKNETDFEAVKNYTKYINSGPYQNTIKYLDSVGPNIDRLVELSDNLDKSKYPILNKANLELMKQSGDPATAAYATAATEVADQFAKIMQGGGTGNGTSDAKINQGIALFNQNYSPEQLKATATEAKGLLSTRRDALESDTVRKLGMGPKAPNEATKPAESLPSQALEKVKNALGSPVTFGNGQTWHWDAKTKKGIKDN